MTSLQEVTGGNPFAEHPQLRTIWPPDSAALAEEAALESIAARPYGDDGELYLVMQDGQVIGITGFFYCEDILEPYLRWHGIVPAERKKGYSRAALALVVERIKTKHPGARGLTELVPQSTNGKAIAQHFAQLGFVENGPLERYDWSPYAWQPVRLCLDAASSTVMPAG